MIELCYYAGYVYESGEGGITSIPIEVVEVAPASPTDSFVCKIMAPAVAAALEVELSIRSCTASEAKCSSLPSGMQSN